MGTELNYLPDFLIIPSLLIQDKNLQPLDHLVYGIVYWYKHLKLEKCIASNQTIAELLESTSGSIANSLSRLHKNGYIEIILDPTFPKKKVRLEIIPLILFKTMGLHQIVKGISSVSDIPISSVSEDNNNIEERENLNKQGSPLEDSLMSQKTPVAPQNNRLSSTIGLYDFFKAVSGQKPMLTEGRKRKIAARLKAFPEDQIKIGIEKCFKNSFYSGQNDRGWKADIDYVFRTDEIMERLINLFPEKQSGGIYEG